MCGNGFIRKLNGTKKLYIIVFTFSYCTEPNDVLMNTQNFRNKLIMILFLLVKYVLYKIVLVPKNRDCKEMRHVCTQTKIKVIHKCCRDTKITYLTTTL